MCKGRGLFDLSAENLLAPSLHACVYRGSSQPETTARFCRGCSNRTATAASCQRAQLRELIQSKHCAMSITPYNAVVAVTEEVLIRKDPRCAASTSSGWERQ